MLVTQDYLIYDLPLQEWNRGTGWEVKCIGDVANVVGGGTPDTENPAYWHPGDVYWATPTDISACSGIHISQTERKISQEGVKSCAATILPPNSILLTSRATIGECRINSVPMATNQGFASLVPKPGNEYRFLFYLAQFLKPTFVRLGCGSTYLEVSRREIRRVRFPCPDDAEQTAIADALTEIDKALSFGVTVQLARLRQTLLHNLLTGRIRIRNQ